MPQPSVVDYLFNQSAISDRKNRTNFPSFRARRLPRATSSSINRRDVLDHSASSPVVNGLAGMSAKIPSVVSSFAFTREAWYRREMLCSRQRIENGRLQPRMSRSGWQVSQAQVLKYPGPIWLGLV